MIIFILHLQPLVECMIMTNVYYYLSSNKTILLQVLLLYVSLKFLRFKIENHLDAFDNLIFYNQYTMNK